MEKQNKLKIKEETIRSDESVTNGNLTQIAYYSKDKLEVKSTQYMKHHHQQSGVTSPAQPKHANDKKKREMRSTDYGSKNKTQMMRYNDEELSNMSNLQNQIETSQTQLALGDQRIIEQEQYLDGNNFIDGDDFSKTELNSKYDRRMNSKIQTPNQAKQNQHYNNTTFGGRNDEDNDDNDEYGIDQRKFENQINDLQKNDSQNIKNFNDSQDDEEFRKKKSFQSSLGFQLENLTHLQKLVINQNSSYQLSSNQNQQSMFNKHKTHYQMDSRGIKDSSHIVNIGSDSNDMLNLNSKNLYSQQDQNKPKKSQIISVLDSRELSKINTSKNNHSRFGTETNLQEDNEGKEYHNQEFEQESQDSNKGQRKENKLIEVQNQDANKNRTEQESEDDRYDSESQQRETVSQNKDEINEAVKTINEAKFEGSILIKQQSEQVSDSHNNQSIIVMNQIKSLDEYQAHYQNMDNEITTKADLSHIEHSENQNQQVLHQQNKNSIDSNRVIIQGGQGSSITPKNRDSEKKFKQINLNTEQQNQNKQGEDSGSKIRGYLNNEDNKLQVSSTKKMNQTNDDAIEESIMPKQIKSQNSQSRYASESRYKSNILHYYDQKKSPIKSIGSQLIRKKALEQANQDRKQFYSNFLQNSRSNSIERNDAMSIMNDETVNSTFKKAIELYGKYDLKYSQAQDIIYFSGEFQREISQEVQQKLLMTKFSRILRRKIKIFIMKKTKFIKTRLSTQVLIKETHNKCLFPSQNLQNSFYNLSRNGRQKSNLTTANQQRRKFLNILQYNSNSNEQSEVIYEKAIMTKDNSGNNFSRHDMSRGLNSSPLFNNNNNQGVNSKKQKSQGPQPRIIKKKNNMINPQLNPENNITSYLLNRSVRGRPIQNLLHLVKGELKDMGQANQSFNVKQSPMNFIIQTSPKRNQLFNQTLEQFKSNKSYVPYFALDPINSKTEEEYYFNKEKGEYSNFQKKIANQFIPRKSSNSSKMESYALGKNIQSNDWAETQIYRDTKNLIRDIFNQEKNLLYFTFEEVEKLIVNIQERQNLYDNFDVLKPIVNKSLKTLEEIFKPMNLQNKYEKIQEQYEIMIFKQSISIDDIISLLIRIKLSIQSRGALFSCLKQIRKFEQLLQEVKDFLNQSLDVSIDEVIKIQNLPSMVNGFFQYADNLIENIQDLKDKHNLYKQYFAFKRKDYIKYILREKQEIKCLSLVFEPEGIKDNLQEILHN
ncbi:UNKNOWN [Stylonychia lemnae]|uniref:Uncharacterized protein n=1 Tax=Stylonychia lemnae TaxID=5949 RepID=A0A078AAK1_STYLE|nr:UNKNOWN [Stylonychia lemnae]|eukprot:CDW77823.1 UNKNOWN [Stylonychia lemnae]